MANEEHVALLRQGVNVWNAWREKEPIIRPNLIEAELTEADLRGANLFKADLHGANLFKADLTRANLFKANLSRADLREAFLSGADLRGADLTRADLRGADLSAANLSAADLTRADLSRADLSGADLSAANLSAANLRAADLTRAILSAADLSAAILIEAILSAADLSGTILYETALGNVDLSGTKGLDQCVHWGPSIIDHRTLQKSGSLPLVFLRGFGLPNQLIEYLPSLLNQPIRFYSCFISYSSKDQDFAERLHADLQNKGVRCWFAPHDLPWGAKTWDTIDEAIRLRDKVLLILSKRAIASDWVEDEVNKAYAEERRRKQIVLFPVRLDNTVMKTNESWASKLRDQRNIGDFTRWKDHDAYRKSFERLMRDLTVQRVSESQVP